MTSALAGAYRGRRVFITGHTGFKGSWLSLWLAQMGAEVTGYALAPATNPAMFDLCDVARGLDHHIGDIRDPDSLGAALARARPEIVFHLAAQPIVRRSYAEPIETLDVNVMGTARVLEAVRALDAPCAVVVVTSDKCYDNKGWVWGYRENDPMGGHDPYSMSKGAAELVVDSWRHSFFSGPESKVRLASGRAGNVIGGGDWAEDRILTDSVRSLCAGEPIQVRNPAATRPWQHVLEPLSGYLWLGRELLGDNGGAYAEGWNFGPPAESVCNVGRLADTVVAAWGGGSWRSAQLAGAPAEAMALALNCDKAIRKLAWIAAWDFEKTVEKTVEWYRVWNTGGDLAALTLAQIAEYEADASRKGAAWAQPNG